LSTYYPDALKIFERPPLDYNLTHYLNEHPLVGEILQLYLHISGKIGHDMSNFHLYGKGIKANINLVSDFYKSIYILSLRLYGEYDSPYKDPGSTRFHEYLVHSIMAVHDSPPPGTFESKNFPFYLKPKNFVRVKEQEQRWKNFAKSKTRKNKRK
jgi:hypothetical protein